MCCQAGYPVNTSLDAYTIPARGLETMSAADRTGQLIALLEHCNELSARSAQRSLASFPIRRQGLYLFPLNDCYQVR